MKGQHSETARPVGAATGIDVVVPTYRRPSLLERCLVALTAQAHLPRRVIVVARSDDAESQTVVRTFESRTKRLEFELVLVEQPGVIAAMSAGVAVSSAPLIAFTDDDARPRPDWLARIAAHFEDLTVGGVGGRDVVPGEDKPTASVVGRFNRMGKLVGNHHLGGGLVRDVDVLKGVNMAFRAEALALPADGVLRGSGAQVDFEVLTSAWAKQQGWRLVYDPSVLVDHDGAPRQGEGHRNRPGSQAAFDAAYNSIIAATVLGGAASTRRTVYPIAVGTRDRPGLARAIGALARGETEVLRRLPPSLAGCFTGLRDRRSQADASSDAVVPAAVLRGTPGPADRRSEG